MAILSLLSIRPLSPWKLLSLPSVAGMQLLYKQLSIKETVFCTWAAFQPCRTFKADGPHFSLLQITLCLYFSPQVQLPWQMRVGVNLSWLRALSCWTSFLSSLTWPVVLQASICYSTDVSMVMICDVTRTQMWIIKLICTWQAKRSGNSISV